MTNPLLLRYSDEDVLRAKEYVGSYLALAKDENERGALLNEFPWDKAYIVKSAVHPTTDAIIPRIFRVSAIAPINIPIVWYFYFI